MNYRESGLRHFANGGSWYISSNNLCTAFGKKGGHLLGIATSLAAMAFPAEAAGKLRRGRRVGLEISTSHC